jgi:hypothetical protein
VPNRGKTRLVSCAYVTEAQVDLDGGMHPKNCSPSGQLSITAEQPIR